jgi:hypothetical protein
MPIKSLAPSLRTKEEEAQYDDIEVWRVSHSGSPREKILLCRTSLDSEASFEPATFGL